MGIQDCSLDWSQNESFKITIGQFYFCIAYLLVPREICFACFTLQGTNISHLEKRKIIFPATFKGDMLVPRRVPFSKGTSSSTRLWEVLPQSVGEWRLESEKKSCIPSLELGLRSPLLKTYLGTSELTHPPASLKPMFKLKRFEGSSFSIKKATVGRVGLMSLRMKGSYRFAESVLYSHVTCDYEGSLRWFKLLIHRKLSRIFRLDRFSFSFQTNATKHWRVVSLFSLGYLFFR